MPTVDDIRWFKQQFSGQIQAALPGTPFDLDMIVAIACQETGYIWSVLRKKQLPLARILALCVGDSIDFKGPGKGRQAFPRNKAQLLAKPNGQAMFDIAREALVEMAGYVPGYGSAVANPDKFCHGYGVFQRDLQFFLPDPDYFLHKKYQNFPDTLSNCLSELHRGLVKLDFENRVKLSDTEFAHVAIAYNTGGYNPTKGLKQGYFDGEKYYGERIYDFVELARSTGAPIAPVAAAATTATGRFVVIARGGLELRGGPGKDYKSLKTLPAGTDVTVVATAASDPAWVQVDLEGDGLLDGYVFAAFLAKAEDQPSAEEAPEPE